MCYSFSKQTVSVFFFYLSLVICALCVYYGLIFNNSHYLITAGLGVFFTAFVLLIDLEEILIHSQEDFIPTKIVGVILFFLFPFTAGLMIALTITLNTAGYLIFTAIFFPVITWGHVKMKDRDLKIF